MEILKKRYQHMMIRSVITTIIIFVIFGVGFYALALKNSPEYIEESVRVILIYLIAFGVAFIYAWILLFIRKNKSVKALSSLNSFELESLVASMNRKDTICECCFLENHLVWTKGIQWKVLAYDNIKSIRKDYSVTKSYGVTVGKFYNIILTMKAGKPKVVSLAVNQKQFKNDYPRLCQELEKIDPAINTLSFASKVR